MADILRGNTSVSKIYRGQTELSKVYRGQTEIWSAGGGLQPVNTNLLFWVDAGLASSYPGSGTTWTDITPGGSSYNMTLVNTPTYTSGNAGYFSFNGTDQHAAYVTPGGDYEWWDESANPNVTFEIVCKSNSGALGSVFSKWGAANGDQLFEVYIDISSANRIYSSTREVGNFPFISFSSTDWIYLILEFEYDAVSGDYLKRIFVNKVAGSISGDWTNFTLWNPSAADTRIGGRTGAHWSGDVGVVRVYDTLLTSDDKIQNYDYFKSRGYSLP